MVSVGDQARVDRPTMQWHERPAPARRPSDTGPYAGRDKDELPPRRVARTRRARSPNLCRSDEFKWIYCWCGMISRPIYLDRWSWRIIRLWKIDILF